ncbi:hypothetical protein BW723_00165 [Polaribacter reichenbachii]|uniref:Uncharacterized protein n=1 Tax=Polaribacter reichenbachii TaxID=996801 RepID=A0A1B8U2H9_9FLAO|nr:hypothetical protein [Polaribacter reichenbachii]APZ44798.1 hypothetical protein BW723_00165 [Polaribacter reichenbachii]AUC18662.1 hypothetical protein BTO17_08170 [Polaribacter reichenbachii]OBY65989.1 hypothetical protein LPB301_07385 [Polaribacter reichenbachii]
MFSQTDSTNVSFVAYWSLGDLYEYKVSKIQQQTKEGKLVKDRKSEYTALFEVIDSTATSYTISWKYENDLGNNYNIPQELLEKFEKYKFTEVKYKTSETGEFLEILNWKEISNVMSSMIDEIVNVLGKDNEDIKNKLATSMQAFKNLYSTQQGVEQLVIKELQYFHFPMGYEFNTNETLIYKDQLPNMFGGNPIKADGKVYFESVEADDDFCVFKQELDLDPKDSLELLKSVLKKLGITDDKFEEALKTSKFEIKDRNTYEYYYYPGLPHRIETERISLIDINNEKGSRVDKTIIELQYQEE